jgi:hypothetical protein
MDASGQRHPPCTLHWERTPIPSEQEAEWAPVWTCWRRENLLAPTRIQTLNRPACNLVAIPTMLECDTFKYSLSVDLTYVEN